MRMTNGETGFKGLAAETEAGVDDPRHKVLRDLAADSGRNLIPQVARCNSSLMFKNSHQGYLKAQVCPNSPKNEEIRPRLESRRDVAGFRRGRFFWWNRVLKWREPAV